jgi:DNA-binding NarL/FixJ family response regulator
MRGWSPADTVGIGDREMMTDDEVSDLRTVVVVDDHRTFTQLLTMALDGHERLRCVGTAADARSAHDLLLRVAPDVVVIDHRLGEDDGLETAREVVERFPHIAVVMLTAYPTSHLMRQAAASGVSALVPKDGLLQDLIEVLVTATPDTFEVPPALLRVLMNEAQAPVIALSPRELDVLERLAGGRDVRRIARELDITINTTRGHVKTILSKLGAHSQLEAVAIAHRAGILASSARS